MTHDSKMLKDINKHILFYKIVKSKIKSWAYFTLCVPILRSSDKVMVLSVENIRQVTFMIN